MFSVEIFSLQGVGRSWSGFVLALARVLVALPAAYVLLHPLGLPLSAAWIALVGTNLVVTVGGYWWVRTNIDRVASHPLVWVPTREAELAAATGGDGKGQHADVPTETLAAAASDLAAGEHPSAGQEAAAQPPSRESE